VEAFIAANETTLRLVAFGGVLVVMAVLEAAMPRRQRSQGRVRRWISNLGVVVVSAVLVRLVFALLATGVAVIAEERGWGLFNNVDLPYWLVFLASILLLDLVIYLQHVLFHAIPTLWRLHMMHHTDLDLDVTSGLRFHPIEIVLSMVIKMAAVAALGPPAAAVVVFEVLLNATAMFNHANFRLPLGVDRILRLIVVTPDMHRVHHSIYPNETNSNYGFNFPWWDRLFGTYRPQPMEGHEGMTIGLEEYRDGSALALHRLLVLPFIARLGPYPINRRDTRPPSEREAA
tara:strand:+ start:1083 stop:1946 length:864 start_codon:yes stop_codon:yes gene_type:complete